MSLALAGRLLTTDQPGKPLISFCGVTLLSTLGLGKKLAMAGFIKMKDSLYLDFLGRQKKKKIKEINPETSTVLYRKHYF